jgi:hypothetical protein
VHGIDAAGEAIVGHLGDLAHLGLGERHIGGHYPDRRFAARRCHDAVAAHDGGHGIAESLPVLPPGTGKELVGIRMVDITYSIHGADRNVSPHDTVACCPKTTLLSKGLHGER